MSYASSYRSNLDRGVFGGKMFYKEAFMNYLAWIVCIGWLASLTAVVTFTYKMMQHHTNEAKSSHLGCDSRNCKCKTK